VVTDFGLAKWLSSGQKTSTVTGTLKYMGKFQLRLSALQCWWE
jgi:serine/threonine protein kinase